MNINRKKAPAGTKREEGFLLIELVIAMMVLCIGILALMSMQLGAIKANASARRMTQSTTLGADRLEKLLNLSYDDPLLDIGTTEIVDGRYTIQWVVSSAGVPIENVKTIDVTISCVEAGQQRRITHVYYKADQI